MQTKKLFKKRMGLSRVLTEIIFLLLATTTAVGAFTIYNSYSSNMSGTTKIVIEQAEIIASQGKAYVTIKNVGTIGVNNLDITVASTSQQISKTLPPGGEATFIVEGISQLSPGQQYTIIVKVLQDSNVVYTTSYVTTAKP